MPVLATVIGDVVGSRRAADRGSLHERLVAGLAEVNQQLAPATLLRLTVGDEYQGCFDSVGRAAQATLRLRLALGPQIDVRHGIGWGEVSMLSDSPRVEDGPGWWAARQAIDDVAGRQREAARRRLRTGYVAGYVAGEASPGAPDAAALNAALMARDELLGRLDPVSLSVLAGMLRGMSQTSLASDLGISPSAVSQRVRRDGLAVLVDIDRSLGEVG